MQSTKDSQILNSVAEAYQGIAQSWDRVRRRPGKVWDALLPYIPQGARVLDVGCGNGRLSEFLASRNIEYTGVDGSPKLIEIAQERYFKSTFLVSDMRTLPFESDAFTVVSCLAALHHLPSASTRKRALQEMFRVATPGGVLLLTNWNLYHPMMSVRYRLWPLLWGNRDLQVPWKLPEEKKVFHRYYHSFFLAELRTLVTSAGWEVEKIEYRNTAGPAHLWNGLFSFVVARKPVRRV